MLFLGVYLLKIKDKEYMRVMNKALKIAHLNHVLVWAEYLNKASYSEITLGRWRLRQKTVTGQK